VGGQKTTTTPVVPDELHDVYKMQTQYAQQQLPAVSQLTTDVMSGNDLSANPYVAGLYSTIQRGADRPAEQTRMHTPRGAGKDYAIAQAYRDAGMQRGEVDAKFRQQILQHLQQVLSGYNPQRAIGSQTEKPPFGVDMGIGPFSVNSAF